jgi:hypothetical protein
MSFSALLPTTTCARLKPGEVEGMVAMSGANAWGSAAAANDAGEVYSTLTL